MTIAIIDYGMGNLRSVQKAFEQIGCAAAIITTPQQVRDAPALVLPGVGAFGTCYRNLDRQGLIEPLCAALRRGTPFLGICLGMQILFTQSEEFGSTPGLDIITGTVKRFQFHHNPGTAGRIKIPHMGWNTVHLIKQHPCLNGIADGAWFYFVHSFYVSPEDATVVATTTEYGGCVFVSSIAKDNIFACQFHPEKSQTVGLALLKNFAAFAEHG
ncbi:MAG: imidazole glycerol phosphate synthase subunit HisH [Desulfobacterota bacterium]|nr:imidazole glycerol phosphate synthase subunit HisH [Thermodesulfobacteriota bacterium]